MLLCSYVCRVHDPQLDNNCLADFHLDVPDFKVGKPFMLFAMLIIYN